MANRYVDFSASNDGDGTTAAQAGSPGAAGAWNTLVGKSITSHTVWIRRSGTPLSVTATLQLASTTVVGWPKSTDDLYATRPAAGSSAGWDADSADYAEIRSDLNIPNATDVAFILYLGEFYRLKLYHTRTTNSGTVPAIRMGAAPSGGVTTKIKYCYFKTDVNGNGAFHLARPIEQGFRVSECLFEALGASYTFDDTYQDLNGGYYTDCTFSKIGPNSADSQNVRSNGNFWSRCTFVCTQGVSNNCFIVNNPAANPNPYPGPYLDGCTFDNSTGATLGHIRNALSVNGRCTIRSCTVLGRGPAILANCPPLHFTKIQSYGGSGLNSIAGIQISSMTTVKVDNLDNTTTGSPQYDILITDGILLARNVKWYQASETNRVKILGTRSFVYLQDEGSSGTWRMLTHNGEASKSTVVRTSGESYSILAQKTMDTPDYVPIELFGWPGFERIYVPLVPGSNTITLYAAHKDFSTDVPTCDDVWFEFEYLDAGSGPSRATATTKANAALTSDGSTWTPSTGLTVFKLVKTLSVTQGQVVGIRLYQNKSRLSGGIYGKVYYDPKVVVT